MLCFVLCASVRDSLTKMLNLIILFTVIIDAFNYFKLNFF